MRRLADNLPQEVPYKDREYLLLNRDVLLVYGYVRSSCGVKGDLLE
jgi:hypothetical protein